MKPIETYLRELRDIRSSGAGVKETSYYPALSNLLNEVGKRLKPRVRCIINLANRGAGLPDGGLFTPEQFQKASEAEPLPGQLPARGVIEVKSAKDDAWLTAEGEQVSRYWGKYRQVLVTNYRDFVLVGQDADGKFAKLESFRLADSEKAFWAAAAHPGSLAKKIEARFEEYLLRVMRHAAQLTAPEDVAWFLASYARDASARIAGVELAALATVLREELNLPDGLANKNVYVLDPCCGTGSYLVEVLDRIHRTLEERGEDALTASDLKEAAQNRVFGFEILPAPFVVSHLQLGLLLQNLGAPLSEKSKERVGVYLTNALTGWEPPKGPKAKLLFSELEEERDAAEHVKRDVPILVILGNPPYNSFAGISKMEEERDLSEAYRTTKLAPAPQGQGLNDLYVRFFRMAERRIVQKTGRGVVCLISNYSWLDGLSFTGMRERYLEAFDHIWIDCLNGDKYKTGKLTPEGEPDPSVFSTEFNREGIQVGTAIALLVVGAHRDAPKKGAVREPPLQVRFRHLWGKTKRQQLLESAVKEGESHYQEVAPSLELRLSFMPAEVNSGYYNWPFLTDLFPTFFPGVQTKRDDLVIDFDRERLIGRMMQYFDADISHEQMREICPRAMEGNAQFNAKLTRERLLKRGFLSAYIVRYCYRPFDIRWLYWEPQEGLLGRKSPDYFPQVFDGNVWIEARQKQPMERFDRGYAVRILADNFGNGFSDFFPLYLRHDPAQPSLADVKGSVVPNLSDGMSAYVSSLGAAASDSFYHAIAVLHCPTYRRENSGALRQDWPRIPLPENKEFLLSSAVLGRQIVAFLDTETDVGAVREPPLQTIAAFILQNGMTLNEAEHFAVTAGWGHAGQGGVTMPGKGNVIDRDYTEKERASLGEAIKVLGERTCDVYLNEFACWSNIPLRVWEYTIGGYQVMKKWLSYREEKLLGRPLTKEEVRNVQEMARRIAAILLLEPALDANYQNVKAHAYPWKELANSRAHRREEEPRQG